MFLAQRLCSGLRQNIVCKRTCRQNLMEAKHAAFYRLLLKLLFGCCGYIYVLPAVSYIIKQIFPTAGAQPPVLPSTHPPQLAPVARGLSCRASFRVFVLAVKRRR